MNENTSKSTTDHPVAWLTQTRPDILRYCRALTGNSWEADDLAQDTIVRVLDRVNTEPDMVLTKPYVFRAARNLWIDRCRRRQRHGSVSYRDNVGEQEGTGDEALITRELLEQLMHRLSPKPFVIVLLCDVFGMTARETGNCIQMTEGTVQVALSRARKKLRELAQSGDDDVAVQSKNTRQTSDSESLASLLEAVTAAFRRHNPTLIYHAYLRLFETQTRISAIRSRSGRLYFTFCDPDGNVFMVSN